MYDLIVVGGGPAALSAAFYALGKHLNVAIIFEDLGGKIGWLQSLTGPDQEHYLPGNELIHDLTQRILTQPDRIIHDRVVKVERTHHHFTVSTTMNGVLQSTTVLIATGASPLPLNVPGADHLLDRGLGYSPTTYAHLVAGQRVAVIGSSQRALSGAAEVAHSAEFVYLIAPQPLSLATPLGHALRQQPNIEVLEGYEVVRLGGTQAVEEIVLSRHPYQRTLNVARVFAVLGLVPNSGMVRDLAKIDSNGFVLINAFHETSIPGLYAAGDVSSMFSEQVLTAIGDGARAAMTAYDYVLARRLMAYAP